MIWSALSNSASRDRCVMSPVWIMKAGRFGSARIFATAASSVAVASGFAALLKPTWLSLICRKLKAGEVAARRRLGELDRERHAAGERPEHPRAGPEHAFERAAPRDAWIFILLVVGVVAEYHHGSPLRSQGRDRSLAAETSRAVPAFAPGDDVRVIRARE